MSEFIMKENNSARNKARVATIIVALIVFLCLYFITFSNVNKRVSKRKKPQEKGVVINFGTRNKGMGEVQQENIAKSSDRAQQATELVSESILQPTIEDTNVDIPKEKLVPIKETKKAAPKIPKKQPKKVITQKKETKKVISKKEKVVPKKKEVTPTKKSVTKKATTPKKQPNKPKTEPKVQPIKQKADAKPIANKPTESKSKTDEKGTAQQKATPTINDRALYPGKKNVDSKGEGNTDTSGDQGVKSGSEKKGRYKGTVSGTGDSGVNYIVNNRKLVIKPTVLDKSNVEGRITVNIKVDRDGNVISASLSKPTTITNNAILQKTLQAAKQAKFNKSPRADIEQFGQMTFIYTVK